MTAQCMFKQGDTDQDMMTAQCMFKQGDTDQGPALIVMQMRLKQLTSRLYLKIISYTNISKYISSNTYSSC